MPFHEFLAVFGIPTTIGGVVWLLVQTFIVFIVIVISDRIINHEFEAKHALILSFVAYFLPGFVLFGLNASGLSVFLPTYVMVLLPFLVWVLLGELILKGDFKTKFIVALIAFVTYFALNESPLRPFVLSMIPF